MMTLRWQSRSICGCTVASASCSWIRKVFDAHGELVRKLPTSREYLSRFADVEYYQMHKWRQWTQQLQVGNRHYIVLRKRPTLAQIDQPKPRCLHQLNYCSLQRIPMESTKVSQKTSLEHPHRYFALISL